jgi:lysyl endopeptidase
MLLSRHAILLGASALLLCSLARAERIALPALDLPKLTLEDRARDGKAGVPLRYGVVHEFSRKGADMAPPGLEGGGSWLKLKDGSERWWLQLDGTQARSLELGFSAFRLPAGAKLEIYAAGEKQPAMVLTDADNPADGRLHTAMVGGPGLRLELTLPNGTRHATSLQLATATQGYRDPFVALNQLKSGSCNIDVACSEGDNWRPQIRSVAHYTFSGFVCTGQLVATGVPAQDFATPRFLTAHHCVSTQTAVGGMVFYWGYQSPTCRTPGSASSGTQLPTSIASATQSGATLLATHESTDFTIVSLNGPVPASADAFYSGWDRSGSTPSGAVGIHHPAGHEKRIAIDLNPLTTGPNCIITGATATTHWYVGAWNRGTTEGGSSGSGLWDPQSKRLVGVLSGGQASCSVPDGSDCYGALDKAWTGGGTAASRMRDWMDRGGGNPNGIDGYGSCNAPSVSLSSNAFNSAPRVGDSVSFSATASGGSGGGYTYEWDLDGDGVFERSGTAPSVSLRYARAQSGQVRLQVRDGAGCTATVSRALDVAAARITASAAAPQQVCGNGNSGIEPGERWRLPVTLTNSGDADLPAGAHALFANGVLTATLPGGIGPNTYGHLGTTSAASPNLCGYQFVDIGDAAALSLNDDDDGRSGNITLGGSGFRLYGENFSQAVMSTNGYVSFSTDESGEDWDNSCIGEINRGGAGPRLHVLHDDLLVSDGGGLRYRYYATCPRAATVGGAQPCHVFQWDRLQNFSSAGSSGDASFQAIAYITSGEVVYQYRRADVSSGGSATIGLIDRTGADPLNASCNAASAAPANRAMCMFDPQNLPVAAQARVQLEAPTLALPSALAAGASVTLSLPFKVSEGASCGAPIVIDYLATAAPGQHTMQPARAYTGQTASSCAAVSTCPAANPPQAPRRGFFNDPNRGGNGIATYLYGSAENPVIGAIWYTGDRSHLSDWYTFSGAYNSGLVESSVFISRNRGAPSGFLPETTPAGSIWLASVDSRTQLLAWDFGSGRSGAELMASTAGSLPYANPDHTNAWIQDGQEGWGLGIEGVQLADGPLEFFGVYFYDASGLPRWLSGTSRSATGGSVDLMNQRAQCPGCPFYPDAAAGATAVGTLQRTYSTRLRAQMSTTINLPAPLSGSWNRSNVTIQAFGDDRP